MRVVLCLVLVGCVWWPAARICRCKEGKVELDNAQEEEEGWVLKLDMEGRRQVSHTKGGLETTPF